MSRRSCVQQNPHPIDNHKNNQAQNMIRQSLQKAFAASTKRGLPVPATQASALVRPLARSKYPHMQHITPVTNTQFKRLRFPVDFRTSQALGNQFEVYIDGKPVTVSALAKECPLPSLLSLSADHKIVPIG